MNKKTMTKRITIDFECGCSVSILLRQTSGQGYFNKIEVESGENKMSFCGKHGADIDLLPDGLEALQRLRDGKHKLSCSEDEFCDCITELAEDAMAAAGY